MKRFIPFILPALLMISFVFSISCSKDSTSPNEQNKLSLQKVSGDNQSGITGDTLSTPLTVLVTDKGGKAVSGQLLDFKVTEGSASLTDTLVVTNEIGKAETKVILGNQESSIKIEANCQNTSIKVVFTVSSKFPQKDTDKLNEAGFPLAVGNHWVYYAETEEKSISSDTTVTRWDSDVIWEIKAKEQVLGVDTFRMETTQYFLSGPDSSKSVTMLTWFAVEGDTLRAIASGPQVGLNPVSVQLHKISGSYQDEPNEWPVNVLIFPLEVGKEWTFFRPDPTILGKKVVETIDNVSVPAGNFEAFRVIRKVDYNDPINDNSSFCIVQWFTSVGIVKMTDNFENERKHYDENGNLIDENITKVIGKSTMMLVSYQITK